MASLEQLQSQSPSPLLALPPRVRIRIYAFCAANYINARVGSTPYPESYFIAGQKYTDYPALLRTCKAVAREARPVLYQNARVQFMSGAFWRCAPRVGVAAVGTFRPAAVRNLFVQLDSNYRVDRFLYALHGIFKDCAASIEFVDLHISPAFDRKRLAPPREREKKSLRQRQVHAQWLCGFVCFLKTMPQLQVVGLRGTYSELLLDYLTKELGVQVVAGEKE